METSTLPLLPLVAFPSGAPMMDSVSGVCAEATPEIKESTVRIVHATVRQSDGRDGPGWEFSFIISVLIQERRDRLFGWWS